MLKFFDWLLGKHQVRRTVVGLLGRSTNEVVKVLGDGGKMPL
jgi:hypothetical protein